MQRIEFVVDKISNLKITFSHDLDLNFYLQLLNAYINQL